MTSAIPVSVEVIQTAIDHADAKQLIVYLSAVVAWTCNPNDPNDTRRKEEAQGHIHDVLYAGDEAQAAGYAKEFLQRHSESAAARGGYVHEH
jgi:hypothetical protein